MDGEDKKWSQLTRKRKRNRLLPFAIVIFLSLLGLSYNYFMASQHQNFTVGTIEKIWKPAKGGTLVGFTYSVNNKTYEGNVDLFGFEEVAKPGKRFLVNFPEQYEWEGIMNLNVPIPDGLTAPADGWDEQPNLSTEN